MVKELRNSPMAVNMLDLLWMANSMVMEFLLEQMVSITTKENSLKEKRMVKEPRLGLMATDT